MTGDYQIGLGYMDFSCPFPDRSITGLNSCKFKPRIPMPRSQHYTPEIRLFIVSALYHEAQHQKLPMTKLVNQLLEQSLKNSVGWQRAQEAINNPEKQTVAAPGK